MNKFGELRFIMLSLGIGLGIVTFILFLSSKTAHPDVRLDPDELLLTFLSIAVLIGGAVGFPFHFCEENKENFLVSRLDLKLIVTFFPVLFENLITEKQE